MRLRAVLLSFFDAWLRVVIAESEQDRDVGEVLVHLAHPLAAALADLGLIFGERSFLLPWLLVVTEQVPLVLFGVEHEAGGAPFLGETGSQSEVVLHHTPRGVVKPVDVTRRHIDT